MFVLFERCFNQGYLAKIRHRNVTNLLCDKKDVRPVQRPHNSSYLILLQWFRLKIAELVILNLTTVESVDAKYKDETAIVFR